MCDNMDESGGYYAKLNKPGTESQMQYDSTFRVQRKSSQMHTQRVEWCSLLAGGELGSYCLIGIKF